MKDKLKSILNKIKNNKKKVIGITIGVFAAFIFTFATYNLNNPTYFNRLFANVLNNGVPANSNFEDNTFYRCVVDAYNSANGASKAYTDNLTDEELASITSLTCKGYNYSDDDKITSAKGVEKLSGLTNLDLYGNKLTSIDLSSNTALSNLNLSNNQLTSIDLSKNKFLTLLDLSSNRLTSVDVSSNTSLTDLYLHSNQLTNIDVSNNTSLTTLYLTSNQLTSIDLRGNTSLTNLKLSDNKLTNIDLSSTPLTDLDLSDNKLTNIDLRSNTSLTDLDLSGNQLTNIDLRSNSSLIKLDIDDTPLKEDILIQTGEIYNIEEKIIPPEGQSFTYSIGDTSVATIEGNTITAQSEGSTTLKTKFGNISFDRKLAVGSVKLSTTRDYVKIDDDKKYVYFEFFNRQLYENDYEELNRDVDVNVGKLKINDNMLQVVSGSRVLDEYKIVYVDSSTIIDNDYLFVITSVNDSEPIRCVNCTYELSGAGKEISIKYDKNIIDKKKIIYMFLPEKGMFCNLYVMNDIFIFNNKIYDEKNIKEINDISEIEKDKINFLNASPKIKKEEYNNSIDLYYNGNIIDNYLGLVNLYSNSYDLTKNYIYLGLNNFINDIEGKSPDVELSGEEMKEVFVIKDDSLLMMDKDVPYGKKWDLIKVSSDKYDMSGDTINLGNEDIDLSKISVTNATLKVEDNKLFVMYKDEVVKEFKLEGIRTVFEDTNFNACVIDTYNNKNGTSKTYTDGLTDEELANITELSCSSSYSIKSTEGIEKLTNLTNISIDSSYELKNINLIKNKKIKKINLYLLMSLKDLNINGLEKLEEIYCYSCQFNNIDLSTNKKLKKLKLQGSFLNNIDLSNNKLLEALDLSSGTVGLTNNISEIDLSNNVNLKHLNLDGNGLSYLDLSNNVNLKSLYVGNSQNTSHPNTLIPDFNIKDLMFVGNKFKLDTSGINIVSPKGWEFSYQSDNENVFDIQNNIITAKASGTSNLLIKMGDVTIDTKSIRVSNLEISGNYNVNNDVKYINVKDSDALNSDGSINTDILLNNINVNSDVNIEKNIENNKLILKYNGDKVAEYNIIGYRVINDKLQKYNDSSTGGYKIYMGTKQFDLANDLLLLNCYAEEENDNLVIYDNNKKENVLESIKLLKISSDYYNFVYSENDNAYYVYVKDGSLDLNKIQLSTGLTINNDDWRITIKDDPTYGYNTYSYIYPVSLSQSSEYKIIDDAIYIGLTHEDRSHWIGVNHGNAQKNGDKYDIYTNNGVKVATYNIVGLETNYVSYDSEDLGYQYDFNRSSLLLMSDPFNPLQITSKINAETEYSTDTGILKIFYNKKLIDEIKIINVYIPEKYKIVSGALYLRADKFKESLINNITSVNDINKDKINIINAKGIYVNEEEEDHGEIYRDERIRIYSLDDEDYDESIGDLEIINVLSNKYDLSNDFIYLGTNEFENDIRLIESGDEISTEDLIEEKFFKITDDTVELWAPTEICPDNGECYMEYAFMIDSWTKVKASSNKYDLSGDTITLKDDEVLDLNSITIKNGTIILEGDTLVIKCNDKIVKEIKVKGGKKVTTKPSTTSDNKITTKNNVTTTNKTTQKRIGNIFDRLRKRTTTKKVTTTKKSTIKIIKRTTSNKAIIATTKNNVDINSKESRLFKKTGTKVLISLLVLLGILLSGILYYIKKNNRE